MLESCACKMDIDWKKITFLKRRVSINCKPINASFKKCYFFSINFTFCAVNKNEYWFNID